MCSTSQSVSTYDESLFHTLATTLRDTVRGFTWKPASKTKPTAKTTPTSKTSRLLQPRVCSVPSYSGDTDNCVKVASRSVWYKSLDLSFTVSPEWSRLMERQNMSSSQCQDHSDRTLTRTQKNATENARIEERPHECPQNTIHSTPAPTQSRPHLCTLTHTYRC